MVRVKVLGYQAFSLPENPSAVLVESCKRIGLPALADKTVEVGWETIPVVTTALRSRLELELSDSPDAIFLIGQAGNRSQVALERFAINIKDFSIPDRAGNHPKGDPIRNDGPPAYQQTLPDLEGCLQALRAAGVPAIISNHAGTHMCNQALYEALDIASTTGIRTKCGFIHIPLLEEQLAAVSDREDRHAMSHSMSLETLRRALERVLLHTVGALEAVSTDAAPARR